MGVMGVKTGLQIAEQSVELGVLREQIAILKEARPSWALRQPRVDAKTRALIHRAVTRLGPDDPEARNAAVAACDRLEKILKP